MGSEMCIRDRPPRPPRQRARAIRTVAAPRTSGHPPSPSARHASRTERELARDANVDRRASSLEAARDAIAQLHGRWAETRAHHARRPTRWRASPANAPALAPLRHEQRARATAAVERAHVERCVAQRSFDLGAGARASRRGAARARADATRPHTAAEARPPACRAGSARCPRCAPRSPPTAPPSPRGRRRAHRRLAAFRRESARAPASLAASARARAKAGGTAA